MDITIMLNDTAKVKWIVDLENRMISHLSGMRITFEGVPESTHFEGSPSNMPRHLTALETAQLIREGFTLFREAFAAGAEARPILMLKSR